MTSSISRSTFLRDLSGAPIDVTNMPKPLAKALEAQGIAPADLAGIAGADGKISGSRELNKLFDFVDGFDKNGNGNSFTAQDASAVPTKSGAVHDALKAEMQAARAVANASQAQPAFATSLGVGTTKHPVIDTHNMSKGLADAFKAAGIDPKAAAGVDGRIDSKADWQRLHGLLDAADGTTDGKATAKARDAAGGVVDSPIGPLRAAIDGEVKANAAKPEYMKPGTKPAPEQTPLSVSTDAMKVAPGDQKPTVALDVPYKFQFDLYPGDEVKGGKACFEAATLQANAHNKSKFAAKDRPQLAGGDEAIQVAYAEDADGRVAVDPNQAKIARGYIDEQLDKGRPVLVGVSYADESYNTDKMTDHFVTISGRGYDADGRLFYTYKDPGAGAAYQDGKFYVNEATGKLFKEGDQKGQFVQNSDYELTQVRTYKN